MPGFNQTGPKGQGSMTGRKMGRCTNYGASLKNKKTTSSGDQIEDQMDNSFEQRIRNWPWKRRQRPRNRN